MRQGEWTIGVPESDIRGNAEDSTKNPSARGLRSIDESGKFLDERSAVSADGIEELWMAESKTKSAVAAHGYAGNSAVSAARRHAILFFNEGKKLPQQKILVKNFSIL